MMHSHVNNTITVVGMSPPGTYSSPCPSICRWFATRTYDNAQVTVSSCGRLQNTGVPVLTVRTAPTSTNSGPYGCLGSGAGGCPSGSNAFISTFKAVADTF